mgnify:CR=1 FL=1
MSLFKGIKPEGATHVWYYPNGTPRAWLQVAEWVYYFAGDGKWVAIAKDINTLSGRWERYA